MMLWVLCRALSPCSLFSILRQRDRADHDHVTHLPTYCPTHFNYVTCIECAPVD